MSLRAVLFDLDGVIVNTVPLHFKAWKKMFGDYGVDFTFQDYKDKVDGIPRKAGVRAIIKDLSEQECDKAGEKKQIYFQEFLRREQPEIYPGTLAITRQLRGCGIKTAVVSSSKNCRDVLVKISAIDLYDVVVSGHDFERGKPDPECFLLGAQRLHVSAKQCLVVEDSVSGVAAAKNAGMPCVGVDRYNDPARLHQADLLVTDLGDVTLKQLFGLWGYTRS